MQEKNIKICDLFAGIGGFHLAFSKWGAECVFACEIDKHARRTYEANFKSAEPELFKNGNFAEDINKIDVSKLPDFDILCGGFPCQPFSNIGKHAGLLDCADGNPRGVMFFEILKIIKKKRPKAFFLENVKGLLSNEGGRSFRIIKGLLENEGYSFNYKVIKASDFGLPQLRPRVYMVGFQDETTDESTFCFPKPINLEFTMKDVLGGECGREVGLTILASGRGKPLCSRFNWDGYVVNGKEVRLNVAQAKKMMGFPQDFSFPVSEAQAMKQLGNAVAINPVYHIAQSILIYLEMRKMQMDDVNLVA
ncbi:MAG: DNA cytosine methyltransferase [Lactobacillus sp.]|jgi:DNA (cytosine-5)-methyltransferase 1|nr:DNA cytosine methyltransferase [Lactobacillus sp.]